MIAIIFKYKRRATVARFYSTIFHEKYVVQFFFPTDRQTDTQIHSIVALKFGSEQVTFLSTHLTLISNLVTLSLCLSLSLLYPAMSRTPLLLQRGGNTRLSRQSGVLLRARRFCRGTLRHHGGLQFQEDVGSASRGRLHRHHPHAYAGRCPHPPPKTFFLIKKNLMLMLSHCWSVRVPVVGLNLTGV